MNYYDEKEFLVRAKISRSTLYRFYKKNEELKEETELDYKRTYPESHLKYFNSEVMFDENKVLRLENQSMRNLIDCLVDKESLQYRLWQLDWNFFCTVAYKTDRNKKSCFRQMHGVYEELDKKFGNETEMRLFFSTEPFTNRLGYHNHFVIQVANPNLYEAVVRTIQEYFSYDRIDVKKYDRYKAGLFYVAKDGLVNEDWDLLGNNLKVEGINHENKSN